MAPTAPPLGAPVYRAWRNNPGLGKHFANLHVRLKLMVLHNLFFLVLTASVYFALVPPFEQRVARAKTIEASLVTEIFSLDSPVSQGLPHWETYGFREGRPEDLDIPRRVKEWLDAHPGQIWQNTSQTDVIYRKIPSRDNVYRRITLPNTIYDEVVERAKVTLFLVLGIIYIAAVLLLELSIMPVYVYRPLSLMLNADVAAQTDDRANELIPEPLIPADEIGQIMKSRNAAIREIRRQEEDLERALERLEAQDRLASLGLLSASVAHEMNTPLAVLHGSIEKLEETLDDPAALKRLERMRRVTERLRKISEGLVDFARVRKETMEPVTLRPLMDEAWSLVAIDEKASVVRFENRVPDGERVVGNADRLIQVFVNLLRNALHAVEPSHGRIAVRVRPVQRDGESWTAVDVEDNGPGIPPEVLPRLFDAFVSSRLDARGTGLGLTVAEGIVSQHGGTISAGNCPGGGARLEVILKTADQGMEQA